MIPKPIEEFWAAARSPFSYDLRKNIYIWFGILWGLPIPLVTVLMQMHFLDLSNAPSLLWRTLANPVQWFFLAHPILFGIIFGILGTIRRDKDVQLKEMIDQLREQSSRDSLTGLKNRRYLALNFHDECARSLRRRESISLLFLDIDNFKKINDTYGHHLGDVVLKQIGAYLLKQCRPYDTPVRWGGEEFLVLLRATNEPAAVLFAERIRHGIEQGISTDISFAFTVSIGLTQYQDNDTLEDMTHRADRALYHAKQTGKNRVISWSTLQTAVAR